VNISRTAWVHVVLATIVALAALFFIRLHHASGDTVSSDSAGAGHRLADAWCKQCHAIEASTAGMANAAPDFVKIANQLAMTALSLKVFLQTSHRNMPNLVIAPDQADDLVNYILSLKRN
jgi:mono/diheme cytochrome c family protein